MQAADWRRGGNFRSFAFFSGFDAAASKYSANKYGGNEQCICSGHRKQKQTQQKQ
jgi:hypothetical protein